jgi:hypothetical protein
MVDTQPPASRGVYLIGRWDFGTSGHGGQGAASIIILLVALWLHTMPAWHSKVVQPKRAVQGLLLETVHMLISQSSCLAWVMQSFHRMGRLLAVCCRSPL